MSVKYGLMGACTGLAFAIVIVVVVAKWNGMHIPGIVTTEHTEVGGSQ